MNKKKHFLGVATTLFCCVLAMCTCLSFSPYKYGSVNATSEHINHESYNVLSNAGGNLSGNYYLTADVTISSAINIESGQTVNLCLNGQVLDLGDYNITNSGELNIYDCGSTERYFTDTDNDGCYETYSNTQTQGSKKVSGGVITGGRGYLIYSIMCGGAIFNIGKLNIYGGNIIGNKVTDNGGAIYNQSRLLIKDCNILYNSAKAGGAIYNANKSAATVINSKIQNNTATEAGGGIYSYYNPTTCLIAGTQITMADGSTKNIEEIKHGDLVKTFDHETGEVSSEKVWLSYKGETKENYFVLNFTNEKLLGIVGCHDLLEQSSLKYVTINLDNANEYIGKYFYNANSSCWEQLLSVDTYKEEVEYYSIYTAHHLNCVSNDMLSLPDDVDCMLNIFEFDESLQINQTQKQSDIEEYGLLPYEDVKELMSEEDFDCLNSKYCLIVEGKGLSTFDEMIKQRLETIQYISETNSNIQGDIASTAESISVLSVDDVDANTYLSNLYVSGALDKTHTIIGSGTTVTNNKVGNLDSNVYLNNCLVILIKNSTEIDAGITLNGDTGVFAEKLVDDTAELSDITSSYNSYFSSDNTAYSNQAGDSGLEIKLASDMPNAGVYNDFRMLIISGIMFMLSCMIFVNLMAKKKYMN